MFIFNKMLMQNATYRFLNQFMLVLQKFKTLNLYSSGKRMSKYASALEQSVERSHLNPLQKAMLDGTVPPLATHLKLDDSLISQLVAFLTNEIGADDDIKMPTVNGLTEEESNKRSQRILQMMPAMMDTAVTEMLKTYPVPDAPLNRRTLVDFLRENSFSVSPFIANPGSVSGRVPAAEPGDENKNKSFFFMMNIVVYDILAIDPSQPVDTQTLNHFLRAHPLFKDSFFNKHKSVINSVLAVGAGVGLFGGTYCALVLAGVITGAAAISPALAIAGLTLAALLILAGAAVLVKGFCDQDEVVPPGIAMGL